MVAPENNSADQDHNVVEMFEKSLRSQKRPKRLREHRKLSMRETEKLIGVPETTYRDHAQ